jgi:hypothetical protein
LVLGILFDYEDENEAKSLAMHLVVKRINILRWRKLNILGFQTFSLILCSFALLL